MCQSVLCDNEPCQLCHMIHIKVQLVLYLQKLLLSYPSHFACHPVSFLSHCVTDTSAAAAGYTTTTTDNIQHTFISSFCITCLANRNFLDFSISTRLCDLFQSQSYSWYITISMELSCPLEANIYSATRISNILYTLRFINMFTRAFCWSLSEPH
jgi:hypothetical protein